MKKVDTDLQDIYRSEERSPESEPANQLSELIEQGIRKQWIFNLFAGLLGFALLVALAAALISDYWPAPEESVSIAIKTPYIASYTLPADEQWAVEYRQVAFQADSSEPPGPKSVSSKWVKNAAYHIIMGEQALRLDDVNAAQDHFEAAMGTFPSMAGVRHYLGAVY